MLLMIPPHDLYGDFIFKQDLAPAHTARGTKTWIDAHAITVLDWPANSLDKRITIQVLKIDKVPHLIDLM